mmetsp:Transcript_32937/g.87060  ORF Transcript_32937/g.87060 Transcript_32937/m.87060 type:complete len:312 (+) Transcript_32937:410-1345(+)
MLSLPDFETCSTSGLPAGPMLKRAIWRFDAPPKVLLSEGPTVFLSNVPIVFLSNIAPPNVWRSRLLPSASTRALCVWESPRRESFWVVTFICCSLSWLVGESEILPAGAATSATSFASTDDEAADDLFASRSPDAVFVLSSPLRLLLTAFSFSARRFSAFSFLAFANKFCRRASSISFLKAANLDMVSMVGVFAFSAYKSMHDLVRTCTSSTCLRTAASFSCEVFAKSRIVVSNLISSSWLGQVDLSGVSSFMGFTMAATLSTAFSSSPNRRTVSSKSIFEEFSHNFISSNASSRILRSLSRVSMIKRTRV